MNTEESRKQFELSGLTSSLYRNNEPGRYDEYEDPFVQFAWRAWQAAQTKQQWIPVSERLPENDDECLVYPFPDNSYGKRLGTYHPFGGMLKGKWTYEEENYSYYEQIEIDVTHWMPLPAPPTNQEVE